jgi:Amt family ammonium transporter
MVGGMAALVGAAIIGPRIGKYGKDGKPKAILGHSITLAALGVFILWFSWFGFNGASTLAMEGESAVAASSIFVTTNLSAAAAAVSVLLITWVRYRKPDVSMTLNGALAGLVGITAGCDMVSPVGAAIIGIISGFVVVFGVEFVDKKLRVDDPVGAVAVHGFSGAVGTICVGLFAVDGGLLYGGGASMLGTQALGVLTVAAWVLGTMAVVFFLLKKTIGLRVSETEEVEGLDIHEHGLESGYADFMPMPLVTAEGIRIDSFAGDVPVESAVPVKRSNMAGGPYATPDGKKLTKIVIVTNQSRFDKLKEALNAIGITGMTVTNVMGCGMQKGAGEYYRGAPWI